jgi:hypothetical protein
LPHMVLLTIKVWRNQTPFLVRHLWILDWLESQRSVPALIPIEVPIRRPERGDSEWEPIKILLLRENSAYTPNSQPRIPTRVCQGHVVTTDLQTLGTNPKRSQSGSTNQEAKDLAILRSARRTVREPGADSPRTLGERSATHGRTVC